MQPYRAAPMHLHMHAHHRSGGGRGTRLDRGGEHCALTVALMRNACIRKVPCRHTNIAPGTHQAVVGVQEDDVEGDGAACCGQGEHIDLALLQGDQGRGKARPAPQEERLGGR